MPHTGSEAGYLRLIAALGRDDLEAALSETLAAVCEITGARCVALDVCDAVSGAPHVRANAGEGGGDVSQEIVVVPLALDGRLKGVISASFEATRPVIAADVHRLEALGERLVRALDQSRERAREAQGRDRLVSMIAHDLRGPLQVALSTAALIARAGLAPETSALAARAGRALAHADRMISDLLDAGRARAGFVAPLRVRRCDLVAIAREVAEEMSAVHGDRFTVEGDESVRGEWSADELRRAVWNLASNAVRHGAPRAPIRLRVSRAGRIAEIAVYNQGPPIPPEDRVRLFEPYARGTTRAAGWGLGLTMVRSSAEAHGGSVDVTSAEGIGTTFTIRLPRGRGRRARAA